MPKRTNVFQEVVAIIHEHMAGDAVVQESAMLPDRMTGEQREVDVVIRSKVAGHEVIVSVEAAARGRKADTPWVESLVCKHRDLPTSQLILVAEAGFSGPARKKAEAHNAVALSPEDLTDNDPAFVVVNALPSLWPKQLTVSPEEAVLIVRRPDGTQWRVRELQPDTVVYLADGRPMTMLAPAFHGVFTANYNQIAEMIGLADITEDIDRFFVLGVGKLGQPWIVQVNERDEHVYLRWEESDPPQLHEIEVAEFTGKANIRVGEMPLNHKRLGEVSFAYGETMLGDQPVLIVVTESEGGGKATMRLRAESGTG